MEAFDIIRFIFLLTCGFNIYIILYENVKLKEKLNFSALAGWICAIMMCIISFIK